jgi:RsiW-degrading membrane proteinase PrsW (M82 family)
VPVAPGRLPTAPEQHWALPDPASTLLVHVSAARRRTFWRVLLAGAAVFGLWALLATLLPAPQVTVRFMVFGALFVPVLFVWFMTTEGGLQEPPAILLVEVFAGVAIAGNLAAVVLNSLSPVVWTVGPIEEGIKFLGVVWLLRRRRYASIMDGVLFGAAAGMGFAASESLGYFFNAYTTAGLAAVVGAAPHSLAGAVALFERAGTGGLWLVFWLRSLLAPFMHGAWTAMIAGVAWREAAGGRLRVDARLALMFVLVAAMHSAWDLTQGLASLILLPLIVAVDVVVLRRLILAAHRQESEPDAATVGLAR